MLAIFPIVFLILPFAAHADAAIGAPARWSDTQDPSIPAVGFDRDVDLVRRLASAGYKAQADMLITKLKTIPGLTEVQKAELSFAEASNLVELFDKERDFDKSRGFYDQAKKAVTEFIKIAPKGDSLTKANYFSGDLDRRFGEKIIEQIKRESNAEKVNALRTEGEKAFQAAIKYFAERKAELFGKLQANSLDPKESPDYQAAAYAVPVCYLSFAYLYPVGDANRIACLQKANERFEEYASDAPEGSMAFYESHVKWGNARRDLGGKIALEAVDCYSQALDLLYVTDANGDKFPIPANDPDLKPSVKTLIIEAVTEASRMWLVKKDYDQILKYYIDVRVSMPQLEKESMQGLELILEAAKAYDAIGKRDQAKTEAKRITKNASPDLAVVQEARELLTRLGESAENSEEVTLIQVVGAVERQIGEKNFPDAIRAFQQARDRWRGTSAERKFWPDLILRGALAYQGAGRSLEANLLFSDAGDRFVSNKDMSAQAYLAAEYEACRVWVATKSPWCESLAQETIDKMQAQDSTTPQFAQAQQVFLQTQQIVGGKKPIELAKIGEEQLKGLSKTEPKYGRIVYDTAMKYFRAGVGGILDPKERAQVSPSREGSERCFDEYLEWTKAQQTIDPAEVAKIDERTVSSYITKAEMWLWDPPAVEKTLSYLQVVEDKSSKSASAKARMGDVEKLKFRAHLRENKLDLAIQIADGMYTKDPASPKTAWVLKKLADTTYEMLKKEKDPKKRELLVDVGLKSYKNWVVVGEKQAAEKQVASGLGATDYNTVATNVLILGLHKNNIEKWPGTFFRLEGKKFEYLEPAEFSASLFQKAIASNDVTPAGLRVSDARYLRGQILGLLMKWKDVVSEYQTIVKDDSLLSDDGKSLNRPSREKEKDMKYSVEGLLNDLAWANAQLAARGDKDAGKEAQRLAALVISYTQPKSSSAKLPFDFWFARYTTIYSMVKNGERRLAQDQMMEYRRTDKDLDNGEYEFKKRFEDLEQLLKEK
ncbi:MAG: hypothetical protein HY286_05805 [Planctomycetes bacterium]|nr:hypothetical protein [Planctomycetota bacterium]